MSRRRCRAKTQAGKRCRNWAVRESEAARCRGHGGGSQGKKPGIYGAFFSEEELAALQEAAEGGALEDEIATARIMLRRLLGHLGQLGELSTAEMTALAPLVLKTTEVIAGLMREQQALEGGRMDGALEAMMEGALEALGEEMGLDL